MKQIRLILLFCTYSLAAFAQQGYLKGTIDTKNFPQVSFVWNEYNPSILHSTQFSIKENGSEVIPKIEYLPVTSIPFLHRSVLFLWEDQPIRQNQFDFTQNLLLYFLKEDVVIDSTICFNIAVFNRKQDDGPVLKLKLPAFTSDKEALSNFISDYEGKTRQSLAPRHWHWSKPDESDLFLAIKEGLDLIEKEPKSYARFIFVITAGRNLFVPGIEITPIINQAIQNKIPIYVVYFPTSGKNLEAITRLAKETNGQLILSDGSTKDSTKTTRGQLSHCFQELLRRHYGQDYRITFTSLLPRDGSSHPLVFNVNRTEYNIPSYKTPPFSLIVWAKYNPTLFLIFLTISVAVFILAIILSVRFFKKRLTVIRLKKQEDERHKAMQHAEQENLKRQLHATQATLKSQQKAAEKEKKQASEQEREKQLAKLMYTKNLQPRIISVTKGVNYTIHAVVTTIGRESDNDIVLPDSTVSKHHAQIVFNGSCFEISDLNSSNGTMVNGNFVERVELKNPSVIQLGEIVLKYYL